MYTPTLASILSLQYLFFYRALLKCVNPLTHRNICQRNKRSIPYNLLLLYSIQFILSVFCNFFYLFSATSQSPDAAQQQERGSRQPISSPWFPWQQATVSGIRWHETDQFRWRLSGKWRFSQHRLPHQHGGWRHSASGLLWVLRRRDAVVSAAGLWRHNRKFWLMTAKVYKFIPTKKTF